MLSFVQYGLFDGMFVWISKEIKFRFTLSYSYVECSIVVLNKIVRPFYLEISSIVSIHLNNNNYRIIISINMSITHLRYAVHEF